MSQDLSNQNQEETLEGLILRPATKEELVTAVEQAFDYRGDVTIELKSQRHVIGYVFGRIKDDSNAYIEIFPTDETGQIKILLDDIAAIIFSGKDTAFGQSWESWIKKKKEEGKK